MPAVCRPLQHAKREQYREELIVHCLSTSNRSGEINRKPLVLSGNGEIYIDTGDAGHRVAPHFLPIPGKPYEGLATSTTADAAPIQDWIPTLNWVYLDANSHQLIYGVQEDIEGNFAGPFQCTPQSQHLTFQGWEGFYAVEMEPTKWAIYFDVNDDGLKDKVPPGAMLVEVELVRRGPGKFPPTMPQSGISTTRVEELYEDFEEDSATSSCDSIVQHHVVGTAISIMCTRIERTERHVKEEFLLTVPAPPVGVDGLPITPRALETWCDDSIETEATEHFYSENIWQVPEFCFIPTLEEGLLETPTPSPEDIDKLEADVIAMLGPKPEECDTSGSLASGALTDTYLKAHPRTNASVPPAITSKPLPPLPTGYASKSKTTQQSEIIEQPHKGSNRPDSAIALVQSPTIYPGSPRWSTSRAPHRVIDYRPSRVNLDAHDLAAIEDLSRSLDFGDRPVLSLSAYTHVWPETRKEPPLKRFLGKVNGGNKKMIRGIKNAGPRTFRIKHRKSGASHDDPEGAGDASWCRRHST